MFTESETAPSQNTCRPVCLLKVLSFFFFLNFIFKLYIIVLVLPNIKMNPPQVYIHSF